MEKLLLTIILCVLPMHVWAAAYSESLWANYGTSVETFESITGWTAANCTRTADTVGTNRVEGAASLSVVMAASGSPATVTKDIGVHDFSGVNNFTLAVGMGSTDLVSTVTIEFSSVADFATSFKYTQNNPNTLWSGTFHPRFQRIFAPKLAFVNNGGESWTTARYIRLGYTSWASSGMTVRYDDLRTNYTQVKSKIAIMFDDGKTGVYANAFPIMAANGQRGIVYVSQDKIGTSTYSPLTDLITLYGAGWDISNHGKAHSLLSTVSGVALNTEVNGNYDYLVANGFTRSAKFYAYSGGDYGASGDYTKIAKVSENHVMARSTFSETDYGHVLPKFNQGDLYADEKMLLTTFYVFGTTVNVAAVKAHIDNLITSGLTGMLLFHNVSASPSGDYDYSIVNFSEISNYIKTKTDAGLLDVVTMADVYASYFDPVLSAPTGGKRISGRFSLGFRF